MTGLKHGNPQARVGKIEPGFRFGLTPGQGVGWSTAQLDAFMASQADGFWFDATKTDRFFQDSTGSILAASLGDPIGLALSQRLWEGQTLAAVLAGQPELASNPGGPYTVTTGYVGVNATLSVVSGKLNVASTSTAPRAIFTCATVVGRLYKIVAVVVATNDSALQINASNNADGSSAHTSLNLSASAGTKEFYFFATATTTYISLRGTNNSTATQWSSASAKLVPGKHGLQSSGTLRPTRQTTGAKFDGSDDNWLTNYVAGSGTNFAGVRTTVPATLAATQAIMGASGSGANRYFIAIDTSGRACAGVGSDSTTTIVGTSDLRNTEADIFLTFDGSTVRLIVNGAVEYEVAQNSTPTTTIPFRVGCNNNNGTAGSFYGGAVKQAVVGREFITASTARKISNAFA